MLKLLEDNWLLFLIGQYPHGPMGGLAMAMFMATSALLLCFPFAIYLALARLSTRRWLSGPTTAIVHTVRGLPLIMFIFWTYFFSPLLFGRAVGGVETLIIALVVYEAAYLSEISRAGIEGPPKAQVEAAKSLGMSYWPTTIKVVVPQALHNMLPSMVSQFVSTKKETSLGYVISAHEMTSAAYQANNVLLTQPFEVYGILALTYFTLCSALTWLARYIERRISAGRRETVTTGAAA